MKKNLNLYLLQAYNASARFTQEKIFITISLLSLLFVLLSNAAYAQTTSKSNETELISGTVTDDAQQGLPGVSVSVKGTNLGILTDENGRFNLSVDLGKYNTLVFTYISKKTTELLIEKGKRVDVTLYDDPSVFTELVITGAAGDEQLYTEKKSVNKRSRNKARRGL